VTLGLARGGGRLPGSEGAADAERTFLYARLVDAVPYMQTGARLPFCWTRSKHSVLVDARTVCGVMFPRIPSPFFTVPHHPDLPWQKNNLEYCQRS